MFEQYEVWGVAGGQEQLIECVPTLPQARELMQDCVQLLGHWQQLYIVEDRDNDLREIARVTMDELGP